MKTIFEIGGGVDTIEVMDAISEKRRSLKKLYSNDNDLIVVETDFPVAILADADFDSTVLFEFDKGDERYPSYATGVAKGCKLIEGEEHLSLIHIDMRFCATSPRFEREDNGAISQRCWLEQYY